MIGASPPKPSTLTCILVWSCTTFAMTDACAFSSVPGCRVANPIVACAMAVLEKTRPATAAPTQCNDFDMTSSSVSCESTPRPHYNSLHEEQPKAGRAGPL